MHLGYRGRRPDLNIAVDRAGLAYWAVPTVGRFRSWGWGVATVPDLARVSAARPLVSARLVHENGPHRLTEARLRYWTCCRQRRVMIAAARVP